MIRHTVSFLVGITLAVGLFWLLALLVTPPESEPEKPIMTMTMNMVEAPEVAPEQEAPAPQPTQAAPQQAPPPMPTPEPPPVTDSAITLPEVELPEVPLEPVEMDNELPELAEITPEPMPEPTPRPDPAPEPSPEPPAEPAPAATPTEASAPREAAPVAEAPPSNEPVSVGQVAPTNRISPTYPQRALRRGMEGFVELEFTIRRDGSVDRSSIRVINAQPRRVFEDAAVEAIGQWQFVSSQQVRRATQRIEFDITR